MNKAVQEAEHVYTEHLLELIRIYKFNRSSYSETENWLIEASRSDLEADNAFTDYISNGIKPSEEMGTNARFKFLKEGWRWRNFRIKEWEPRYIDVEEFKDDAVCTRLLRMSCKSKGYLPWFEKYVRTRL